MQKIMVQRRTKIISKGLVPPKPSKLNIGFFVTVNITNDITINPKPDKHNKRPVTLIGESFLTNLAVNKYEEAKQIADIIDSKSPKLK